MQKILPVMLVVGANTVYNICAKQTPKDINPFFSLGITYGVAMIFSIVLYFVTATQKNISAEFSKANWVPFVFGICIVGLEIGFIFIYRAGWRINTASLVANLSLAVILIPVGYLLYNEQVSVRQLIGIAVCAAGLILISKQ